METIGELIQVDEACGNAELDAAMFLQLYELIDGGHDELAQRLVVFGLLALRDVEDGLLRIVNDSFELRVLLGLVAQLDHARAGVDEATEDGLLRDDFRVVACIGCGRHRSQQSVQIRGTTGALELTVAVEAAAEHDGIDFLAVGEQRHDVLEDDGVRRVVEVVLRDDLRDLRRRGRAQQHGTQDALLRLAVSRRLAEVTVRGIIAVVRVLATAAGAAAEAARFLLRRRGLHGPKILFRRRVSVVIKTWRSHQVSPLSSVCIPTLVQRPDTPRTSSLVYPLGTNCTVIHRSL